jgi:4-hydroxy-tetrahydrodipicolinate synthase
MFAASRHLKGYLPDLPTPFDHDGGIDVDAFARLCRRHVMDGGGAFVVCTARGEASTLTQSERIALIRCAVGVAAGRVPVIAGATSNATARAIAFIRDAQDAGAAAVLLGVPYYNKPTQAGLAAHFWEIAKASRVPIILHDEPDRCVRTLDDDTLAGLASLPTVVGFCDASGDLSRLTRLRNVMPSDIRLMSSNDAMAPAFISMGGDGCISGACNVAPLLCRAFYNHATTGDMAKARHLALELALLTSALSREVDPVPLKYALACEDMLFDTLRLPLIPASKPTRDAISAAMAALQPWIDWTGGTVPTRVERRRLAP